MKNTNLNKIIFIHPGESPFEKNDVEILKVNFIVQKFHYKAGKSIFDNVIYQIKLFLWLLLKIWNSKVIVIWFAGYHSLLPILFAKLLFKKSFLIIGGYDVASIPEINYGFYNTPIRKFFAYNSIKWATCNLAVSDFLKKEVQTKVSRATIKVLYTGHSEEKFSLNGCTKENIILTVGAGDSIQRIKLKGIDFLIKLAPLLPNYNFIVIGMGDHAKSLFSNLPSNIVLKGKVDEHTLLKYYQKAKVYAQFSLREGLPGSVCEAMLCECVIVGSNNGGIPIAIGNTGYLLNEYNINKAAELLEKAMKAPAEFGKNARQRVIDNFSYKQRKNELIDLIKDQIG